jgi:tetratricopeptide (TPR) repeat protein
MGATWKDFFLHLTLAGIFQEEAFVPVPISSINEAFPPKPHHKILTHEVPEDRVKADRKEVVEYREKAKKEPDLFLPKLARSLSNLGLSLSGLGQKDEAFKVTVEAVEISRCLNEDPPLNRPVLLGVNLNNLGNRLYEQGKVKEALEPTREAEIIFRELTTKYDGNSKADLARSLWDIGLYLNELGQHEDGLNTTLESVELSRQLVKQNPERFNAYLTSGLNILGKIYSDLELNEEALKATQESEEINKTSGDSKIIHSKPKPETKIDVGAMTIQEIKPQNEIEKYLEDSSIRKGGNPSFVIMMGTVGAGKTTIRRKEYAKGYVNLDAGDIFANLAKGEYLDFPGELEIPLEMVGRMLAKEAIRQKRNMVVEVIGDSTEDTEAMAKVMVTAGYEIVPVLVKCEVKEGYLRHTKAVATDPKNISAYFTQDYHKKWILNAVKGVE